MANESSLRLRQALRPEPSIEGLTTSPEIAAQVSDNMATDPTAQQSMTDALAEQITILVRALLDTTTVAADPEAVNALISTALRSTVAGDFGPPAQPSPPTVIGMPSALLVTWDGKNSDNTFTRNLDFSHVDVHVSNTDGFAPTAATKVSTIKATPNEGGSAVVADHDYGVIKYVKLVSVSLSGRQSPPSNEASAISLQIQNIDVADFALTVTKFHDDRHHLY